MKKLVLVLGLTGALGAALYEAGYISIPGMEKGHAASQMAAASKTVGPKPSDQAPAISVVKVNTQVIQESVLVIGTLVPRLEVLVAPEVEGLRVVELLADEGDRVAKGQVLARLEQETLKNQLAQNDASLARAAAAMAAMTVEQR